jgi:hypothetical protein
MAERILDLLRDRIAAASLGRRAAQLVRTDFNLEVTVERYAAIYDNLVRCSIQNNSPVLEGRALEHESYAPNVTRFGD